MKFFALAAAAFVAAFGTSALAQTTPPAMLDVYSCAQITDDAERLACFDRTVGVLRQAESQGQVVAVDRSQAAEIERDAFGFNLPSLSRILPSLEDDDIEEVSSVEVTVARVSANPLGYHTFVMENDQTWIQIEPQGTRNIRVGDVVTIERASLGSYRLIPSRGGAGHRVRRQN